MAVYRDQQGEMEDTTKASVRPETRTYRVYKRRWAMMVTVTILNISNAGMCFNLAAVAYKAADFFEVTPVKITWFTQVCFIVPLALSPVSTYIINKFDLRAGIHLGSALNCVAAVLRAVATSSLITDSSVQYALSLVAQVVVAGGELFITFIVTKVTQNWFPDNERMMTTAILACSPPLGISLAQVMAPLLVTETHQVPTLNYVYGGLGILAEIITIASVTSSRPPTPPSRSAEIVKKSRAPYLQQLKDVFTCLPFLGHLVMTAMLTGFFLCFSTLSQQMLCSVGYTDLFSGIVVTIINLAGCVGSFLLAVMVNRTKAFTSILKLANGFGVVLAIAVMEIYLVPDQHALLIIFAFLYGCLGCGVFPMSLEMGVEITYPVEEAISSTIIFILGQILGVCMTNMVTLLSADLPSQLQGVELCTEGISSDLEARNYSSVMMGLMTILSVTVILFTLFFRATYKRREAEKTTDSNDTTSTTSSVSQ